MKSVIIDGVKVVKLATGKIELYLNPSFDGFKLMEWRKKNEIELNRFRKS